MRCEAESDEVCLKRVRKSLHMALPPSFIGDESRGVQDLLRTWTNRYVPELEGVLIRYENLAFTNNYGTILGDQPFIHEDIVADFFIFQPAVGAVMKSSINRISKKHVACTVYECVNVYIPLGDIYDHSQFCLGQEVHFKVTAVEYNQKIVRVKGEITDL